MNRCRVKICGMSDPAIVKHAISCGVDAIGLIFYDKSPRYVTVQQAIKIREVVPAFVSLVGVFVNEDVSVMNSIASKVGLDLIQLHGDETSSTASQLTHPYIRAIRAKNSSYIESQIEEHINARGFLVDAYHADAYGGTGELLDISIIPNELRETLIIAGGISPENVEGVLKNKPFAIDVNSGVESKKGIKDKSKITELFEKISLQVTQSV